jgi:hypothetical protein
VTTARTAWAQRKTRASFVCCKKVCKIGKASSAHCSVRVHRWGVSRINYYNKRKIIPRHTTYLPSYRHKTFPTQISRMLRHREGARNVYNTAVRRALRFHLPLSPLTLACVARNNAEDHALMDELLQREGREGFAAAWLRAQGFTEEAWYVETGRREDAGIQGHGEKRAAIAADL